MNTVKPLLMDSPKINYKFLCPSRNNMELMIQGILVYKYTQLWTWTGVYRVLIFPYFLESGQNLELKMENSFEHEWLTR